MHVKQAIYLLLLLLLGAIACMPEEERLQSDAVSLSFSADTVSFDTLFTTEQSITRRLRIFNPSDKAVMLETIGLAGGEASPYSLLVNGRPGKTFGPQQLLGGDSLLVLVEARLPATAAERPYLASDALVVSNKGLQQQVPVVGWGQNARFVGNEVVACNTTWDATLPYVIEKTILVEANCTLTLQKGTRLYFKPGAYLYVKGTLLAEGDSAREDRILFRNHRLDAAYEDQPGQWGGIAFVEGSQHNLLRYCDIRNAELGIVLDVRDNDAEPDLVLEHCRLENHFYAGILCYNTDLQATNTLVANCVGPAVENLGGGHYQYVHCTFANFFRGQRELPALVFTDMVEQDEGNVIRAPLHLTLQNSIVWGNIAAEEELIIALESPAQGVVLLENNLIRTANPAYDINGNVISTSLDYVMFQEIATYNFRPDSLSPAIGAAKPLGIELDLSGKTRDSQPDIGALEYFKK